VHGDEVSGIHAIESLFLDFFVGTRRLQLGSLTLVRANEQALAAERRYVKHNLNRLFREDYGPEIDRNSYEFKRAQELKTVLRNCDYFLDLHSAPIAQTPFMAAEQGAAGFFSKLGIPRIMTGWNKFSSGAIGGDAGNYAHGHGAKSATLESGSGAIIGGVTFRIFSLFEGVNAVSVSLRDLLSAFLDSFLVLGMIWI
jgi:hypothetical protein